MRANACSAVSTSVILPVPGTFALLPVLASTDEVNCNSGCYEFQRVSTVYIVSS